MTIKCSLAVIEMWQQRGNLTVSQAIKACELTKIVKSICPRSGWSMFENEPAQFQGKTKQGHRFHVEFLEDNLVATLYLNGSKASQDATWWTDINYYDQIEDFVQFLYETVDEEISKEE